jgi:excisionase family DNA binding protein
MDEKYYTVEQVSALIKMHPKTIQRYIREGKLRATKIGKGWRIAGHDLSQFAESVEPESPLEGARIAASSVVDIRVRGKDDAIRIMNGLTAALNGKPPELGRSNMHTQFLEEGRMVRVTLWGGARFMEAIFGAISMYEEEENQ